jgi:tetratricopeptide (TPR) repeat protein
MKRLKSTLLTLRQVLIFIGLCGCFQLLVVGLIGVARGYSVQGFWSEWIAIASVFCLIFLAPPQKESRKNVIFYIVIFTLMYSSLVGIAQNRYKKLGKKYYEQGRYQQALEEFKKETQTWYLRLKYNSHEDRAMEMMAKTYCQLEDFDKARDTYELITHRYSGFYGGRAEEYLERLEDGLRIVAKYPDQLSNAKGFPSDLYDIALAYQYDLNCSIKALEVYRKIVDMDIGESSKELARKSIEELTVLTEK